MKTSPARNLAVWAGALLAGLTLAAYLPAIRAGFVWDDPNFALRADLRPLRGLWRIWADPRATEQYFPVLHSLFWVEGRLWGDSAFGYHLANVALHIGAALLLVRVLRRLGVSGAWPAGFVFALHPVCVESVAWISEQKNTLSTVFYFAAALGYLRWREGEPGGRRTARTCLYAMATGFFILAVLSKSVTATLPAALLVVLWWRDGRVNWRRDGLPLASWFAIGAASGFFTAWIERNYIGAQGSAFDLGFVQRVLLAGRAIWFYMGKLAWPANLTFTYPRWRIDPGSFAQCLFPAGFAALLLAAWLLRRRSRAFLAAMLLFSGALFPTLGFLNVYAFAFSYVADHWQYLASPALIALAAAGWANWRARSDTRVPDLAASLVVAILGALTWTQCRMYRDEETLYTATLERNPGAWMAHDNLGILLARRGRLDDAIAHYGEALRINPDVPEIHNNLGNALAQKGDFAEAEASYAAALRLRPAFEAVRRNLAEVHYHEGNAYGNEGRLGEAIREYGTALQLNPAYAEALANRGFALANAGETAQAIADLHGALGIKPDYADAHAFLGFALARAGRLEDAAGEYRSALRLRPGDEDVRGQLDRVLQQLGRGAEAH